MHLEICSMTTVFYFPLEDQLKPFPFTNLYNIWTFGLFLIYCLIYYNVLLLNQFLEEIMKLGNSNTFYEWYDLNKHKCRDK